MLHRAGFSLAHNRNRSQHQAGQQDDERNHARHIVISAFQFRVVPDARAKFDVRQRQRGGLRRNVLRVAADNLRGVIHRNRRRVRVRAIEQELNRGRRVGAQIAAEALVDLQYAHHAAFVHQFLNFRRRFGRVSQREIARRFEPPDEFAAFLRMVEIVKRGRDRIDIGGRHVAE